MNKESSKMKKRADKEIRRMARLEKQKARSAARQEKREIRKAKRQEKRSQWQAYQSMPHADKVLVQQKKGTVVMDFVKLTLGAFCVAFASSVFLDPMGIVNGGVIGIAIVLKELTTRFWGWELPLSVTNFCLNLPLMILAVATKGWKYMGKTICCTVLLSVFLEVTSYIHLPVDDYFLMAGAGGIICGVGVGLAVSGGATTGGSDLLAAILQTKAQHLSVPSLLQVLDLSIVAIGLFVFDWQHTLYAAFTIIITTYVGDLLLGGMHRSKAVYIISDAWEGISKQIISKMSRGVTGLHSTGLYSNNERKTLFCVVSVRELVQLKRIVYGVDPEAFVIVSDVQEVLGEGFQHYNSNT